jgi:hypothetical protein
VLLTTSPPVLKHLDLSAVVIAHSSVKAVKIVVHVARKLT